MKGEIDDPSSPEVGRAASWATKFERLLADNLGVAMFRDFLQKEFRYGRILRRFVCLCTFAANFLHVQIRMFFPLTCVRVPVHACAHACVRACG